ncbi:MAG: hypothetical protein ABH883_03325, partial [Candidatus Omnitrophota bacterium]
MRLRNLINILFAVCFMIFIPIEPSFPGTRSEQCDYWDSGNIKEKRIYNDAGDLSSVSSYREDGTLEQRIKYDDEG